MPIGDLQNTILKAVFPKIVDFSPNLVEVINQSGLLLGFHLCHQNN